MNQSTRKSNIRVADPIQEYGSVQPTTPTMVDEQIKQQSSDPLGWNMHVELEVSLTRFYDGHVMRHAGGFPSIHVGHPNSVISKSEYVFPG